MGDDADQRVSGLDEHDLAILEFIERDFDVNLQELAEELELSKSAIHYRLKNLREQGVIEGVTADLDPAAFGLSMLMITDVSVDHERGYADDIGEQIGGVAGVNQVYYTMGDVDFVVVSRVQNRSQMNEVIDEIVGIDGVDETSSRFAMKEIKTDANSLPNLSDDMRDRILEF